jgi:hypothetical protein
LYTRAGAKENVMLCDILTRACVLGCFCALASAQPLTTSFTFQGQLQNGTSPATGGYDAQFRLFSAPTGGTQLGPTLCADNLTLTNGQLTAQLDFGSVFTGQQAFLEVSIRQDTGLNCSNPTGFQVLSPRQAFTATPNAIFSLNAGNAVTAQSANTASTANAANTAATASNALTANNATQLNGQPASFYTNAANLTGALPSADLSGTYSAALNLSNASNVFQGSFTGSGAGLTSVPWSGITGAPATVLLQSTSPGTAQSGSLNVTGIGIFGNLRTGFTITSGSPGVLGDILRAVSDANAPCGLATRSGVGTVLSLDMNLGISGFNNASNGAAVRMDSGGSNLITFLTRAAGTAQTRTVMSMSGDGTVGVNTNPDSTIALNVVAPTGPAAPSYAGSFLGNSPGDYVLSAVALANTGSGVGVIASCRSPSGNAGFFYGPCADTVIIQNSGSGRGMHVTTSSDTAVWAEAASAFAGIDGRNGSTTGRGVFAAATATSGVNYGLYGSTSSPAGYGVYSQGNFAASGGKAFRIDHPADPEHKYLLHYCTESPEVLNFYSGKVTLNGQGEATIDLPPYFARINKDPRYLLTPIGAAMPLLHVAGEISDDALAQGAAAAPADPVPTCSFRIAGGAPNAKVSWRVEALRNDRWVQAHGAPVEVEKDGPERGTYQHPDLYNQTPETSAFNAASAR